VTGRALAFVAVAFAVALAMRTAPSAPDTLPPGFVRVLVAPGTAREAEAIAEIVATPEDRNRGLGMRESLPRDCGMLFVYPFPEPRTFWMKDCLIPLDIAFIGEDRRILNVETLPPGFGRPDAAIARAQSAGAAPFVLEMNSGWFAAHGVRAGDEVRIPSSVEGLAKR
jgi:uncharacterized membrane protein (UPF0127 family)